MILPVLQMEYAIEKPSNELLALAKLDSNTRGKQKLKR